MEDPTENIIMDNLFIVDENGALVNLQEQIDKKLEIIDKLANGVEESMLQTKSSLHLQQQFWNVFVSLNVVLGPALLATGFSYFISKISCSVEIQIIRKIFLSLLLALAVVIGTPLFVYNLQDLQECYFKVKDKTLTQKRGSSLNGTTEEFSSVDASTFDERTLESDILDSLESTQ